MSIKISMDGQDADDELASLYTWLREDDEVRRHASISYQATRQTPGEMGAYFDLIQLAVDGGFQALNFALAYATWRQTRRSRPTVTIECNGVTVTLSSDTETVNLIVRMLEDN